MLRLFHTVQRCFVFNVILTWLLPRTTESPGGYFLTAADEPPPKVGVELYSDRTCQCRDVDLSRNELPAMQRGRNPLAHKQKKASKASDRALLVSVAKEMAKPRIAESAQADGDKHSIASVRKPA